MRKVLFILGELADEDLNWILEAGRSIRVEGGESIIVQGDVITDLFIIADGGFSVIVSGHEVARLGSGEVVGDMSLLDSRPPSATITALESSQVFAVPHSLLRRKLAEDDGFAARFYRALCIFLADRLGRTTAVVARSGVNLPADPGDDAELSPELLDNVSLAGARFEWFLERLQGARR